MSDPSGLYGWLRPWLFRFDAETAHWMTVRALATAPAVATLPWRERRLESPVEYFGLRFPNRIGLAAGMDKNAEAVAGFARLGFGFVEVGTVTPRPQAGNPRPRLFRYPEQRAVINRLGFNNDGVDACLARLESTPRSCIVGVNIGKNRDTPAERAADDYVHCLERAHALADYITVNVSSPNTPGLRDLQHDAALAQLLDALEAARQRLADRDGQRTPVLLKLAPDMDDGQLASLARLARERGMDGLIATNTTIARPGAMAHCQEQGGLSGRPLAPLALHALGVLRRELGRDFPIVAVGGIDSEEAARERLDAGADLLQVYTGMIYEGPGLPRRLARAAAEHARR